MENNAVCLSAEIDALPILSSLPNEAVASMVEGFRLKLEGFNDDVEPLPSRIEYIDPFPLVFRPDLDFPGGNIFTIMNTQSCRFFAIS